MMIHQFPRSLSQLRLFGLALAVIALSGQAPLAVAQSIEFPQKNVSDLRGLLNVFHAFRRACLQQPVDRDLPTRLVPEGYQIVSQETHLWGTDTGGLTGNTAVLSKTGREQDDWDGGHPFVTFLMPSQEVPDGRCSVAWKRAWDYQDGLERLALGMFGVFDAQVSFYLEAVLRSSPEDLFILDSRIYGGLSDWFTWCWDGNFCSFKVLYSFDPESGIDILISRVAVQR